MYMRNKPVFVVSCSSSFFFFGSGSTLSTHSLSDSCLIIPNQVIIPNHNTVLYMYNTFYCHRNFSLSKQDISNNNNNNTKNSSSRILFFFLL